MKRILYILVLLNALLLPQFISAQWSSMLGPLSGTFDDGVFMSMSFVNDSTGFLVQNKIIEPGLSTHYILKTADYANSWDTIFTFIDPNAPLCTVFDIYFINEFTGWFCGSLLNNIYRTNDGGYTWTGYPLPKGIDFLNKIKFVNENYGVALSNENGNTSVESFDGGNTWSPAPAISGRDISFHDSCNYIVASSGAIIATLDCIVNSEPFPTINEMGARNGRAVFMKDNNNWIFTSIGLIGTTNFGSILSTNDGGNNFTILDLNFTSWMSDLFFLNQNIGFAITANTNQSACSILKTTNGGDSWSCQETPVITLNSGELVNTGFIKMDLRNDDLMYGLNRKNIYRTTNGGGPLGDTYTGVKVTPHKPKTLSLYPNPTSTSFRIEATQPNEVRAIEIYNATGQIVAQYTTVPNEMDVRNWPSGCYNVVVKYDNEVVRTRVVVE